MGRKYTPSNNNKELNDLVSQYEAAKTENRQYYLDGDAFAAIADYYDGEHRYIDAQEVIDQGLHIHPNNMYLLIQQSYLYLDTDNLDLAKEVADKITENFETDVKILKAEILLNEGQLDGAKEILSGVENDDLDTIVNIVYLYLDMGYPEAAEEWIKKGEIDYNYKEDFIGVKADFLSSTNQLDEAAKYYNQLIDIDPYNATYWIGLAKSRFANEECEQCIEACDFALAADEDCGEAYAFRAHSYFYLDNADEAIENYLKAIEYKSIPPEMGYMFLGMVYGNKGEWENARDNFQKVIDMYNANGEGSSILTVDTYTHLATATYQLHNYEEAHQLCEKAKAIDPDYPTIALTEGKIYLKEGLNEMASKAFSEALEKESGPEMWYLIGSAYADEDQLAEAKYFYEKTYDIDPQYMGVVEKLTVLNLMLNSIDDFFKYNKESKTPINAEQIIESLSKLDHSEETKQMLIEVLARMREEKGDE